MRFSTRAIHAGQTPNLAEGGSGDVVPPIHMASTFARRDIETPTGGYEYSRSGNPTRDALETALAGLEEARHALAFASGLAAIDSVLKLLRSGDEIVASDDLYGGTRRLFEQIMARFGLKFIYVDMTESENVARVCAEKTKMIWIETPTNPLLKLCDIKKIAANAHARNPHTCVVVDNTFASPYFQRPLALGANIALHSTTKYIGGHSDVIGGAVMLNDDALFRRLKFIQNAAGAVPSPFDCWLVLRGIKTLSLRMERHAENAIKIARYLEQHPKISRVIYPGLPSHPQHTLANTQMSGASGIISCELIGDMRTAKKFLSSLALFALAESLGGVESLIESPALMTHASVPPEIRKDVGISDTLIRLSVGIEDAEDLIADLAQGLEII